MIDEQLIYLVSKFRNTIELTKSNCDLDKFKFFRTFPKACCGETSYLLTKFLYQYGYETIYVNGICHDQSHAWLVLKDKVVESLLEDKPLYYDEIMVILKEYGSDALNESVNDINFKTSDIENGTIIDITSDQFIETKGLPVYIGCANDFYKDFVIDLCVDCPWEKADNDLYNLINSYINNEGGNL